MLEPQPDSPRSAVHAGLRGAGLLGIVACALLLRTLHTDAPFTSADHAMIAYRTTCEPGWRWCFQNHYGPLQPLMTKLYAHVVTGFGIPMAETHWRLPMGIVGAIVPLLAFALARRAGGTREAAWWAAIWTAVLPQLVTDARYMWAYETLGTAMALAAVIATFAYMDRPSRGRAWVAGMLLAAYLQSHLHVYAVPCVVILILLFDRASTAASLSGTIDTPAHASTAADSRRNGTPLTGNRISRIIRTPGLWLPPIISLFALLIAWRLVGGGPIARLLHKTGAVTSSTGRLAAAADLARAWLGHVGWPVIALAMASIVFTRVARVGQTGVASPARTPRRAWFLAIWMTLFAAPLFALGFRTGRPTQYLTQATTAAVILTAVALFRGSQKGGRLRLLMRFASIAVAALLAWGSIDVNLYAGQHSKWTGVTAAWGAAVPNTGHKSAGWYIRKHVPADAVIFALHDTGGLESPVATYYFGRACLAGEDWSPAQSFAIAAQFAARIDVIVDDLRVPGTRPDFWSRDFALAAAIHDGPTTLLRILVRADEKPTPVDVQIEIHDREFDSEFGPRAIGCTPPVPARLPNSREIKAVVKSLRMNQN